MEVLTAHRIRVPDDISLAGFDDTLTARITLPQLTTMRQPFRHMGRRAVEVLLPQINNSGITISTSISNANPNGSSSNSSGGEDGQRADAESLGQEEIARINAVSKECLPHITPALPPARTEVFDVALVVRGSVGPPPAAPLTYHRL
jgi:DNA-binding LacI/PurR family transcriptional regulator